MRPSKMGDETTTSLTYVSTSAYHAGDKAADGPIYPTKSSDFTGSSKEKGPVGTERSPLLGDNSVVKGESSGKLARKLTLINAIGLTVGSIIGSGIFITPNQVLEETGSVGVSFFVWIACGLLAVGGALCFVELGTSIPSAGATYAYILRAFGGLPAFLYIWTAAFVIRPASRAIISLAFAEYISRPFYDAVNSTNSSQNTSLELPSAAPIDDFDPDVMPAPTWLVKLLAAICVTMLCAINVYSVKWMARVQDVAMVVKLLAIVLLIITGLVYIGQGHDENIKNFFEGTNVTAARLGSAFYGGLWAYDGWDTVFFGAEEVDNVAKIFPRAIGLGMSIVIFAYILANIAYMSLLSADGILNTNVIAVDAVRPVLGSAGALYIMPLLVAVSTFGATNGATFLAGRQTFAAAREGSFPSFLSVVHRSWQTPIAALFFQTIMAIVYLIPGDIGELVHIFSFASWVFYGSCFVGLIVLRFREPHLHRPYKVFIAIPVLMACASLYLIIAPFFDDPFKSLYVTAAILGGIPAYFIFVYPKSSPNILHAASATITRWTLTLCYATLPPEEVF